MFNIGTVSSSGFYSYFSSVASSRKLICLYDMHYLLIVFKDYSMANANVITIIITIIVVLAFVVVTVVTIIS